MEKTFLNTPGSGGLASTLDLQNHTADVEYMSIMNAPVTKLDADQYMAEDLDGVGESLFGSGNLNFLLMQSGQTNEAIALADPFFVSGEAPGVSAGLTSGAYFNSANFGAGNAFDLGGTDLSTDHKLADPVSSNDETGFGGNGSSSSSTLTSLGAASLATNSNMAEPLGALNSFDGTLGTDGEGGINGTSGTNGDAINLIQEIVNIAGDIINLGDNIFEGDLVEELQETVVNLGDTVTNITDMLTNTDIVNLLEQTILGDTINDTTDWLTNTVNNFTSTTNEAADVVNNILQEVIGDGDLITNVTEILENPADVITNVTNLIENIDTGDLLTEVLNTATTTTTLINNLLGNGDNTDAEVQLASNIDLGLVDTSMLDPVLDLLDSQALQMDMVEDLIGDIDLGADIGLDLLGQNGSETDNGAGDSDLSLGLDLGLIDNAIGDGQSGLSLDPVEDILGDIDLDLGLGANLLGNLADPVVNGDEGGTGDDTSPFGMLGDALREGTGSLFDTLDGEGNAGGDLLFDTGGSQIENDLLDTGGDISLDIVENLLGQDVDVDSNDTLGGETLLDELYIDMVDTPLLDPVSGLSDELDNTIDTAMDLLNSGTMNDLIGGDGDSDGDLAAWPENILPDAGDITGGNLGDTLGSVLPDPVGGIAEGLGSVLGGGNDNQVGGFLGGLFG